MNGRGDCFSASDPTSLANSLSGALGEIEAKLGSASAAGGGGLPQVLGDNKCSWRNTSQTTEGDRRRRGAGNQPGERPDSKTPAWSTKTRLDTRIVANVVPRDIRYFPGRQPPTTRVSCAGAPTQTWTAWAWLEASATPVASGAHRLVRRSCLPMSPPQIPHRTWWTGYVASTTLCIESASPLHRGEAARWATSSEVRQSTFPSRR